MLNKSKKNVAPCHAVAQRRRKQHNLSIRNPQSTILKQHNLSIRNPQSTILKQHNLSIRNPQSTILKTSLPWIMWIIAILFYGYRYVLDVFPGVAAAPLMASFQVNATMLGVLASLFFYPYAFLQVPIGMILDKFGSKRLLTLSAIICALGAILFATAQFFWLAALGRFLMGLGAACTAVGAFYIAATWLPKKHFTLFSGIIVATGMTGAVFGQAPIAHLVQQLNWRNTTWILAIVGIVFAFLIWFIVQDKKDKHKISLDTLSKLSEETTSLSKKLNQVLHNRQNWLISFYGSISFMPTIVFGALWGVPFLLQRFPGYSASQAASILSVFFIGWAFGAPLIGHLGDLVEKRRRLLVLITFGMLFGLLYTFYWPHPSAFLISVALFIAGFCSGGSVIICGLIRDNNRPNQVGTALGFMNMIDMVFGMLGQPLVGTLLDLNWHGKLLSDGTRFYTLPNYQHAFWSIIIVIGIAFIILAGVKDVVRQK